MSRVRAVPRLSWGLQYNPEPPTGVAIRTLSLFFFLLLQPLSDSSTPADPGIAQLVLALGGHMSGPGFKPSCVQYFYLRFFGLFYVPMLLTPSGYPPTAVGYPPTGIGYPPTAVGYPPTASGYPPTAIG